MNKATIRTPSEKPRKRARVRATAKPASGKRASERFGSEQDALRGVSAVLADVRTLLRRAGPKAVLTAAGKLDPFSLAAAKMRAPPRTFDGAEPLLAWLTDDAALHATDAAARAGAAISILARLRPSDAEPLARRLARADLPAVLSSDAAMSLAGRSSDETVNVLFDAIVNARGIKHGHYHNPLRRAAGYALAESKRTDVAERALATLTDQALAIKGSPTQRNYVAPTTNDMQKQDFVFILLYVIGRLGHRKARPRLGKIMRSHPIAAVKQRAGEAILFSATPAEIRAVFGEDRDAFFAAHAPIGLFDHSKVIPYARKLLAAGRDG